MATAADGVPAATDAATADAAPRRRPVFTWAWRAALVAALALLAAVDQWRYVLAIGHGERDRLAEAARLNPYDSGTYLRLAQAESAAGDPAAAAAALRRAVDVNPQNPLLAQALVRRLIEANQFDEAYRQCQALLARWPDDVNALVNAGVLADRLGDAAAAERWWTQAVARDPSQRRVHLYLAERLDARGATRDALAHYRRYLELAARAAVDDRPDPREVVAIVVKFGDALARDGQVDTARRSTTWRSGWPARPGWPTSARSPPIDGARSTRPALACASACDRAGRELRQNLPPSTRKLCAVHAPPSSAARNSTICANSSA